MFEIIGFNKNIPLFKDKMGKRYTQFTDKKIYIVHCMKHIRLWAIS